MDLILCDSWVESKDTFAAAEAELIQRRWVVEGFLEPEILRRHLSQEKGEFPDSIRERVAIVLNVWNLTYGNGSLHGTSGGETLP